MPPRGCGSVERSVSTMRRSLAPCRSSAGAARRSAAQCAMNGSKCESQCRRQENAKPHEGKGDRIVRRNSKHVGPLVAPTPTINASYEAKVPQASR